MTTQNAMTSRNFKLGAEDMKCLKELCIRWDVSQSEAVRRAVRMAALGEATPRFEPKTEDEEVAIWEMLSNRVDLACFELSKLENRVSSMEAKVADRGEVTYGLVSFDPVEEESSEPLSDVIFDESALGKKRKKKSKKAKKGAC